MARKLDKEKDKLSDRDFSYYGLKDLSKKKRKEFQTMFTTIRKVFRRYKNSGGTNKKQEGKRNANSSLADQCGKTITVMKDLYLETGKTFTELNEQEVTEHLLSKYGNNFSNSAYIAAVGQFQSAMEETNILRNPPKLMEREENGLWSIANDKKEDTENDWIRHAQDSTTLKTDRSGVNAVRGAILESKFSEKHKIQSERIVHLTSLTGQRLSGALAMRVGDIQIDNVGNVFIPVDDDELNGKGFPNKDDGNTTYHQEKGGHHRVVEYFHVRDKEAIELLTQIKSEFEGSSPDRRIFEFRTEVKRDSEGNFKSGGRIMTDYEAARKVGKIVGTAGKRVGINETKTIIDKNGEEKEINVTFSVHSGRGVFTQERVNYYCHLSPTEQKKEIDRRIEVNKNMIEEEKKRASDMRAAGYSEAQIQEKHYPNFAEKYQTMVDRINWVNKKKGIRRTSDDREPNHKEMAFFLASLDIGHQRVDAIRFYAKYPGELYKEREND